MLSERVKISDFHFDPPASRCDVFGDLRRESGSIDFSWLVGHARRAAESIVRHARSRTSGRSRAVEAVLLDPRYQPVTDPEAALCRKVRGALSDVLKCGRPVEFIVSLFPCKIAHPLRTLARSGHEVDIGEVASLLRFYEIALAVSLLHKPGAKVRILSNGYRYTDVFGEHRFDVPGYRRNVEALIRLLGISAFVELDVEETLYPIDFAERVSAKQKELSGRYESGDETLRAAVTKLRPGIFQNLQPRQPVTTSDMMHIVRSLDALDVPLSEDLVAVKTDLLARWTPSTLRYIAVNECLRECGAFESPGGSTIKLTVHPKEGQVGVFPINRHTRVFPHNGQGVVLAAPEARFGIEEITSEYAVNLCREPAASHSVALVLPPAEYEFSDGRHPFAVFPATRSSGSQH